MSLRKNNAYNEDKLLKVLKGEAEKNGFKVKVIEDKTQVKKK